MTESTESSKPSPGHTVTFTPGAWDEIERCLSRLDRSVNNQPYCKDSEELAAHHKLVIEQLRTFLRSFTQVLRPNPHNGNVRISSDGPESLFFRYDSGYDGGMILHGANGDDPRKATWSIHLMNDVPVASMVYGAGTLAYIDSFIGLIPCRVLRVEEPSTASVTSGKVVVKVTATRPGFVRGEVITHTGNTIVPRTHVRVRSGQFRIGPGYLWA